MAKSINSEAEYKEAVSRIDTLLDINPKEGDELYGELKELTDLVYLYGKQHYPIGEPDPAEVLKYIQEEENYAQNN